MRKTAAELNDWLAANHQNAINELQQQGMTLRFVDGAENYHQDHPSLAVGAEGVGFTLQTNYQWQVGPIGMVEEATNNKYSFKRAFAAARQQFGDAPLAMTNPSSYDKPYLVRGQRWDIVNHQAETTAKVASAQRLHWMRTHYDVGHEDVSNLVTLLCERQALYDRLRTPEGVLALVREPGLTYRQDEGAYALKADKNCLLMVGQADQPEGPVITVEAFYWDSNDSRFCPLLDKTSARLTSVGIQYQTDGFGSLTPSIEAKDLGMEPAALETMVAMDMKPIDILQYDVAKAQVEASAGADYLASFDGDVFLPEESQDQGFMC